MAKIRIMKHHLSNLVGFLSLTGKEREDPIVERYRKYFDNVYGGGYFDKMLNWVQRFDPETTSVIVLNDKDSRGRVNIDDFCMQGCIYHKECSTKGTRGALLRMLIEKPRYFPMALRDALLNKLNSKYNLANFEDGGEYLLGYIIKEIKKKS